ncbi:MAG: gliding motility-associated C-terminal domain-containing protein, partial [Bacteroidia bacterium]|nr:gliding motility-associated C-terminal domain-containing protein [Bacteroidia bacterium]
LIDRLGFSGVSFSHTFNTKGLYPLRLIVKDVLGCVDTLIDANAVLVGDTIAPDIIQVYRVSVQDDRTVEIAFRKTDAVDFKSYQVFIEQPNGSFIMVKESFNKNDTVLFVGGLNTLPKSYCMKLVQKNICNLSNSLDVLEKHCTVEVSGKPGVNVSYLKWNAYSGWNNVKEYHVYREDPSSIGTFDSIGKTPFSVLNYNDTTIRCYNVYRYKIKAIQDGGYNRVSWSDTCRVKPIWINKVPENEVWRATVENNNEILLEWVELKKPRIPIVSYRIEKSRNDGETFDNAKTIPADEIDHTDGLVKVNDYSYTFRILQIDECGDKSGYSNIGKTVLLKAEMSSDFKPMLTWTGYRQWNEGVDHYIVEHKQLDGTFLQIGKTKSGSDTTFIDELTETNCRPDYTYRVIAVRAQPAQKDSSFYVLSVSNESSAKVVSKLWVPNAMSPDGNNINERLEVKGVFIKQYHIEIFDRWGEKLFESSNCIGNWDGTYKGEKVQESVYLYHITALGVDNKHYNLKGTFTLFR